FRRQTCGNQRHPGSKVAAVEHAAPAQFGGSRDDDAMSVGEEHVGPHTAHLLKREKTQLVHPVVNQRASFGLRGEDGDKAYEVARKTGPEPRRDPAQRLGLRWLHFEDTLAHPALDVHPLEHGGDNLDVLLARAFDMDFTPGDRANHRPAPCLTVIAAETT